jgi:hypothetical protein
MCKARLLLRASQGQERSHQHQRPDIHLSHGSGSRRCENGRGLEERARAIGRKEIQPALENAKPVDASPVISAVDEKLQPGINALLNPKWQLPLSEFQQELARIKQQLTTGNGETLFDAQRLHRVQSDIGDQSLSALKKSQSEG